MTVVQALILGIVEGLTEFLPVSSTGHLLLATQTLQMEQTDGHKAFEVAVQAGGILAVLGAYSGGVRHVAEGVMGRSAEGRRLAISLLVAFAITAALGVTLNKPIKAHLFNLWVVSAAWIVGGIAMLAIDRWRTRHGPGAGLDHLTVTGAIVIGLMQSLALCPGVSRSLVTLAGGVLVGLSFRAALEFSFLLGGLTLLAAAGYETVKNWAELTASIEFWPAVAALVAATASAWACVRWMLASLERLGLAPFGWYRIVLGLVTLALLATRLIRPE